MTRIATTPQTGGEEWRDIPGHEGRYQASDLGRIRSLLPNSKARSKDKVLRQVLSGARGYGRWMVTLIVAGGVGKCFDVHRLVAAAFLGPKPIGQVTRHLDGKRLNNIPSNLAYGTSKENGADTTRLQLFCGEKNKRAKLTEKAVHEIKASPLGCVALSKIYGVTPSAITNVRGGWGWKHIK